MIYPIDYCACLLHTIALPDTFLSYLACFLMGGAVSLTHALMTYALRHLVDAGCTPIECPAVVNRVRIFKNIYKKMQRACMQVNTRICNKYICNDDVCVTSSGGCGRTPFECIAIVNVKRNYTLYIHPLMTNGICSVIHMCTTYARNSCTY